MPNEAIFRDHILNRPANPRRGRRNVVKRIAAAGGALAARLWRKLNEEGVRRGHRAGVPLRVLLANL